MTRRVQVFVLCEDLQSQTLLRQYLVLRGYPARALHFDKLPAGCGSQWVRERYAAAVRTHRTRHVAETLVVHLDADNLSVQQRHTQLAEALTTAEQPARTPDEKIALVVPCWETETWLHHFRGAPNIVETHRGYTKFHDNQYAAARPTAVALLAAVTNTAPPPANLPSFATAVAELARL